MKSARYFAAASAALLGAGALSSCGTVVEAESPPEESASFEPKEAITTMGVVIPAEAENSNHNYFLEDDRIPSIETCGEWANFWRGYGPAISFAAAEQVEGYLDVAVSTQIYLKNQQLDENGDGILCLEEDQEDLLAFLEAREYLTSVPVTEVADLEPLEKCRLSRTVQDTIGFELSPAYLNAPGQLTVKVLYFETETNRAGVDPAYDFDLLGSRAGKFLEEMSFDKLSYRWDVEPVVFALPADYENSLLRGQKALAQEALRSVDNQVDFSATDMVVMVFPESLAFEVGQYWVEPMAPELGLSTDEGVIYRATWLAVNTQDVNNAFIFSHEMGHLLGIQDYYWHQWRQDMPYEDQFQFMGAFDNMNFATGPAKEWTGWTRWLLEYLENDQVRCAAKDAASVHQLVALPLESDRTKMTVVPVSETVAVVIESRRSIGYDSELPIANEGALVYVVDTTILNGQGPMRLALKENSAAQFFADAPLRQGESVEVAGLLITNLESQAKWDLIAVEPAP